MAAMAGSPGYIDAGKVWMICVAYESGVGKGKAGKDCNPYAPNTPEHAAWQYGYEFGIESKNPV